MDSPNTINDKITCTMITKFHNFIELLITERYVKVDKELLSASKITLKAQDSYKVFFDNRFLELIQNIN